MEAPENRNVLDVEYCIRVVTWYVDDALEGDRADVEFLTQRMKRIIDDIEVTLSEMIDGNERRMEGLAIASHIYSPRFVIDDDDVVSWVIDEQWGIVIRWFAEMLRGHHCRVIDSLITGLIRHNRRPIHVTSIA